jgi:hypothetical protein
LIQAWIKNKRAKRDALLEPVKAATSCGSGSNSGGGGMKAAVPGSFLELLLEAR